MAEINTDVNINIFKLNIFKLPADEVDVFDDRRHVLMENAIGVNEEYYLSQILQDKETNMWPKFVDDMFLVVDLIMRDVQRPADIEKYHDAVLTFYKMRKLLVLLRSEQIGLTVPKNIIGNYFGILKFYTNHPSATYSASDYNVLYRLGSKFIKTYTDALLTSLAIPSNSI